MHLLKYRDIILPPTRLGLKGKFTVELIHARTGLIKRHLEFDNLITNAGLDAYWNTPIGSGSTALSSYFAVGTGNTAPTNSDTTLVSEVQRTSSNGGFSSSTGSGASFAYAYYKTTRLFTESQANGNLTEIGLFNASSSGTMFVRQLFKDELGDATTITKTSDDQLKITWEFRIYRPADVTDSITISGTAYDYTVRVFDAEPWLDVIDWSASVGAMDTDNTLKATNYDSTAGTNFSSSTWGTYTSGNKYNDLTLVSNPTNFTSSIGSIYIRQGQIPRIQHAFITDKIPKDNTKKLTYVARLSWDRYTPA